MIQTKVKTLCDYCGGILKGNSENIVFDIKIDSREAKTGDMFVCIVGENTDGHKYWKSSYENGCRVFLMSNEETAKDAENTGDASVIFVDNTIKAFESMATKYLDNYDILRVAVTGSVGKTTTKMLTAAVLSAKYNTICTQKNLNTDIGLCLTAFLADEQTQAIVFEMGMDARHQIDEYVSFIRPQIALITNVGISHLERLGTRDEIANAKLEITSCFDENCTLIVNKDSDYLKSEEEIRERCTNKSNFKIVFAGSESITDIKSGNDGVEFVFDGQAVKLPLLGEHNAVDGSLALSCAKVLGINLADAADRLAKVEATDRRLKVEELPNGVMLLDDSYNASPDSMRAGLKALRSVKSKRRIAVLAPMFELGSEEVEGHLQVGHAVGENKVNILIAIGDLAIYYVEGLNGYGTTNAISVEDNEAAMDILDQILKEGDAVLVKGSNGTKVSEVAEYLRNPESFVYIEPDEIEDEDYDWEDEE